MKALLKSRKWGFLCYVIACFLPVIMELMGQLITVMILSVMETKDIHYFYRAVGLSIVVVMVTSMLYVIGRFMRIGFMRDILVQIRTKAFNKILEMNDQQFAKKSKEVYLSHLINDINIFEREFFLNLINVIYLGGRYVVYTAIVLVIDLKIGVMMLIISGIIFAIGNLFAKKTEYYQLDVAKANEELTLQIGNTFNGLEILKLSGVEEKFLDKNLHKINKTENRKLALSVYSELQRSLMWTLEYAVIIGLALYMVFNIQEGSTFTREIFIFQICQGILFPLVEALPRINIIKSSVRIYDKITQQEQKVENNLDKTEAFNFNNDISVEDLSFSYEGKDILKHAHFSIKKGKKYLIKGVSGAGKSTLMKLLSMIYEEYDGKILVDGKNYKAINEQSFNSQVAYVYQDVFLFEDTVANNISLYKNLSEVDIKEAARLAGLEEFLEEQEDGIYTKIKENGKNLSGGQRQRISIARAIAKKASILFIDEGTSALNEAMGKQIEREILDMNCTVVTISHRYYEGVTNQYDYVLDIKNGQITTYHAKDYFEEVEVC